MTNRSWKITTFENGAPLATAEDLTSDQTAALIREAMYGYDPLTEATLGRVLATAEAKQEAQTADARVPIAA